MIKVITGWLMGVIYTLLCVGYFSGFLHDLFLLPIILLGLFQIMIFVVGALSNWEK